jgi:hypothetical protein
MEAKSGGLFLAAAAVVVLVFFFVVVLARVAVSNGDSHAMKQMR